jgi:hydroxyacylglutathione hydrolase
MENRKVIVEVLRMCCREMVNYTYVVIDPVTNESLIIDPSWQYEKIISILEAYKTIPSKILLTHYHYDHVNLVERLVSAFDLDVYIGLEEINYYGFRCSNMNPVFDFGTLNVGTTTVKCYETPGHTKGSMCYQIDSFLFTGDTLFVEGCGGCDMKGGDAEDMFYSIKKIKKLVAPHMIIYPGHAFISPVGIEYRQVEERNIYLQFSEKEQFVQFRSRKQTSHAEFK